LQANAFVTGEDDEFTAMDLQERSVAVAAEELAKQQLL
jgi:hypothetical protein